MANENLTDVIKPHPKPKKLVLRAFAAIDEVSFVLQRDELGRKIAPLKRGPELLPRMVTCMMVLLIEPEVRF